MALKTTTERLEAVQAAIEKVLDGQQVSWDGKLITMASLDTLTRYEERLEARLAAENGTQLRRNRGRLYRD